MEQRWCFPRSLLPALLLGKDFLKDDSRHPAFLPQLQKQPAGQAVAAAMWVPPGVHLPVTAPAASQMLLGAALGNTSLQPQQSPKARQMPLAFALRNQMAVHAPSLCLSPAVQSPALVPLTSERHITSFGLPSGKNRTPKVGNFPSIKACVQNHPPVCEMSTLYPL